MKKCKIVGIYWSFGQTLVRPTDPNWDYAKWVWKSSFFALVTIRDHLLISHMTEANALTTASRAHLPVDHPLRSFLKPFTFHTVTINKQAATSLINDRGLVARIWAFEHKTFLEIAAHVISTYKFRLLPEFIDPSMRAKLDEKKLTDEQFPFAADATDFWNVVHHYVSDYINLFYPSDDSINEDKALRDFMEELCKLLVTKLSNKSRLIDVLAQLICNGTGIHEHVGSVADCLLHPDWIGTKLIAGQTIQSVQTYTQNLALCVVTGFKMPRLIDDWSQLIPVDDHFDESLRIYKQFKADLSALEKIIEARNKKRPYPFNSFCPSLIETSVSV